MNVKCVLRTGLFAPFCYREGMRIARGRHGTRGVRYHEGAR
jgi:hypothetical protein